MSISKIMVRVAVLSALIWGGSITEFCAAADATAQSASSDDKPMKVVPGTVALQMQADALNNVFSNQVRVLNQAQSAGSSGANRTDIVLMVAAAVAGALILRWVAPKMAELIQRRYDPWTPSRADQDAAAEVRAFGKFAETFANGPAVATCTEPKVRVTSEAPAIKEEKIVGAVDPIQEFITGVPQEMVGMRAMFSNIGNATDPEIRTKSLQELASKVTALKDRAQAPALRPFWQMTSALEGLVGQLIRKPAEITASSLRTVANALDLLRALCRPGIRPDVATEPTVRVLAVDDDAICRHAIAFALKKVFSAPDLAKDGAAGLELAQGTAYDIIFLDVEMPGIDGFELCSRIHALENNKATPVVFVTRHSDFDSRAKSSLSGARELMGKPFLTFEVAVKALTMVMQRRLQTEPGEQTESRTETEAAGKLNAEAASAEPKKTVLEPVS